MRTKTIQCWGQGSPILTLARKPVSEVKEFAQASREEEGTRGLPSLSEDLCGFAKLTSQGRSGRWVIFDLNICSSQQATPAWKSSGCLSWFPLPPSKFQSGWGSDRTSTLFFVADVLKRVTRGTLVPTWRTGIAEWVGTGDALENRSYLGLNSAGLCPSFFIFFWGGDCFVLFCF